jgi:hypothetical protein
VLSCGATARATARRCCTCATTSPSSAPAAWQQRCAHMGLKGFLDVSKYALQCHCALPSPTVRTTARVDTVQCIWATWRVGQLGLHAQKW